MAGHRVTTDITNREKIFINANGDQITKLRHGEIIPKDSKDKVEQSGGSPSPEEGVGEEGKEQTPPDVSVEQRMDNLEGKLDKILEKLS